MENKKLSYGGVKMLEKAISYWESKGYVLIDRKETDNFICVMLFDGVSLFKRLLLDKNFKNLTESVFSVSDVQMVVAKGLA